MINKNIIFILICLVTLNFSFRDFSAVQAGGAITNQVLLRIIIISFLTLVNFLNLKKILNIIFNSNVLKFLYLILSYFVISSIWSVYPLWTLYKSLEILILVSTFFLYVDLEGSPFKVLKKLMIFLGTLISLTYFNIIIGNPVNQYGIKQYGLFSTFPIINPASVALFSLYFLCLINFLRLDNIKTKLLFIFSLVTLFLSQNRSTLISLVVLTILYALFHKNFLKLRFALIIAPIFFIISPLRNIIFTYLSRGDSNYSLMTLSSRTITWAYSFSTMVKQSVLNQLFGFGAFAGVRFKIAPESFFSNLKNVSIFSTDNFWLDTFIDNGILGLILIITFFIYLITIIKRIKDYRFRWFLISIFVIFMTRSIFTTNIFYRESLMFYFLVSSVSQFPKLLEDPQK